MKRMSVVFLLLGGIFAWALRLGGWGAVEIFCPTHQHILGEAYVLLQMDDAFKNSSFPFLSDIMRWEGVEVNLQSMLATMEAAGVGPDVPGNSNFSDHYFNPAINLGFAPIAVLHYYSQLLKGPGQGEEWGKGACWSSHFLSDMTVPHHVIGIPKAAAEQVVRGLRPLTEADTGPLALYGNDPIAGWGAGGDFSRATKNFFDQQTSSAGADWYDPWYANGAQAGPDAAVALSSHVGWEKWAHDALASGRTDIPQAPGLTKYFYDPAWKNAAIDPFFSTDVVSARATAAGIYASVLAAETRKDILRYLRSPREAMRRAIAATATMWRSSFSALRPRLEIGPGLGAFNPLQRHVVLRVGNVAEYEVDKVVARITTVFPDGQSQQAFANVAEKIGVHAEAVVDWELNTRMPGDHRVIVEVQGAYRIPDLQYARVEASARLSPPESTDELSGLWQEEPYPGDRKVMMLKIFREGGEYVAMVDRPWRVTYDQTGFLFGEQSVYAAGQKILVFRDTGGQEFQGQVVTDTVPGVMVQGRGWVYNYQMSWRPCRVVWDGRDIFRVYYQGYLMNSPANNVLRFARVR